MATICIFCLHYFLEEEKYKEMVRFSFMCYITLFVNLSLIYRFDYSLDKTKQLFPVKKDILSDFHMTFKYDIDNIFHGAILYFCLHYFQVEKLKTAVSISLVSCVIPIDSSPAFKILNSHIHNICHKYKVLKKTKTVAHVLCLKKKRTSTSDTAGLYY